MSLFLPASSTRSSRSWKGTAASESKDRPSCAAVPLNWVMRHWIAACLALLASLTLTAQEPPAKEVSIQDNSFLLEESYNQEERVVQHISSFVRYERSGSRAFTFTQEWPVSGVKHQLSYTIPFLSSEDGGKARKLGDVALNYRYQLVGDGEARVACAPRLTVLFPTGDSTRGYGSGDVGYQVGIPLSVVLGRALVGHVNVGATWTPSARNPAGERAGTFAPYVGGSLVWLVRPTLNFFVETLYTRSESVVGQGRVESSDSLVISPSLRAAINVKGGLQIVPALAFPIGVGPNAGDRAVLLYLSFEHPF